MQVRPLSIIIIWWTFSETLYKRHNVTLGMTDDFGGIVGAPADVVMDHIDEGENGIPSRDDIEAILGSIKDFLEASFEEKQLKMPTMCGQVQALLIVQNDQSRPSRNLQYQALWALSSHLLRF